MRDAIRVFGAYPYINLVSGESTSAFPPPGTATDYFAPEPGVDGIPLDFHASAFSFVCVQQPVLPYYFQAQR